MLYLISFLKKYKRIRYAQIKFEWFIFFACIASIFCRGLPPPCPPRPCVYGSSSMWNVGMCSGVRGMCSGVQMSLNFYKEVKEKTKTKEIVKKIILTCKSEIYMLYGHVRISATAKYIYISKYIWDWKSSGRCVCASFCYSIEPLNVSDFVMNLTADFNMLQFL